MIQDELVSFLEWTAGIEIVGGIVSVFTVGIAEAPTQAVEAAEVANAASKVLRILRALVEIARTVAETIGTLLSSATRILGDLKKFLNARSKRRSSGSVRSSGGAGSAPRRRTPTRRMRAGRQPRVVRPRAPRSGSGSRTRSLSTRPTATRTSQR